MSLHNLRAIVGLAAHPGSWKLLQELYKTFRLDPHFSWIKILKSSLNTIRGEKIQPFKGRYQVSSFLPPLPSESFLQVVRSIAHPESPQTAFTQQALGQRSAPLSFFLAVTSRCRYSCFHCSSRGRAYEEDLSTAQWLDILGQIQDMGTAIVGFTGGEPLEREDLETLIAHLDQRVTTYVFTSALGLTPARARSLKKAGLYALGISLDSWDPAVHDKKRGILGAAATAWEGVKTSRKAGLYTLIQTMIPKRELSWENIRRLLALAKRLGAQEVRILEPMPCGQLGKKDDPDLFYTPADRQFLIDSQFRANRSIGYPKLTTFAHTESFSQFGCGAGTQHSYITADGRLQPCDFVPLNFGSAVGQDLSFLWRTMNQSIGRPKKECFAHTLRTGPISDPRVSQSLCESHRSPEFPRFYSLLQNKK